MIKNLAEKCQKAKLGKIARQKHCMIKTSDGLPQNVEM